MQNSRRHFRWAAWALLAVVAAIATAAGLAATRLQRHADRCHRILRDLGEIEVRATAQAGLVWRALTRQLVDERMAFVQLRGEEQRGREALYGMTAELADQQVLVAPTPEVDVFADAMTSFLGSVQGTFGQMELSVPQIRRQLEFWDMNFGRFAESLAALRTRDTELAQAATDTASTVTQGAVLVTLLTAGLFAFLLSQLRARRTQELQAERFAAVSASEARFRELLQNASDLIVVVEPGGALRYATPSAQVLADSLRATDDAVGAAAASLAAAADIEAAIRAGALDQAERAVERSHAAVERALGVDIEDLLTAGRREVTIRTGAEVTRTFDVQARDLRGNPDIGGVVLNARDVSERKVLEEQLRHQALHDPLTNLPNRREFRRRYAELDDAGRAGAAVLFLDLDGFKLVNDSYGHQAGDDLLRVVACRLASCLGERDVLARQGGDEFLVLSHRDPGALATAIAAALAPPFALAGGEVFVSASIGIVRELHGLDAEQAAQRADIAMYAAKHAGKAQAVAFAEAMLQDAPERLALESDFRRALERGEFSVVYQPKVGFQSGRIESLEALVRWQHPERGFVSPATFVPFAEESGLIAELGRFVLDRACTDAARWRDTGVVVAVNLSPVQFRNPDLVGEVGRAIERSGIAPERLELEITESAVLGDVARTIEVLEQLKALGCRLAIDDFGTGYSNLAHLKNFPVDVLKIDQAFVRGGNPGSPDHLSDGEIVKAVIGMAKAFDLHVVAEGVETRAHADELRELGADLGQGYFFSKPVSCEAIDALLVAEAGGKPCGAG